MSFPKWDYKEYPKTLRRDDLWGQVRRTVHGEPVSSKQIGMIVDAIQKGLRLQGDDVVLDLACGNGALSSYLFDKCKALHGVDSSEYLVEIANERFNIPGKTSFEVDDAAQYVLNTPDADLFTKVLCYGSFPYFPEEVALAVLERFTRRFRNVRRMMIGNLPDADLADRFYQAGRDYAHELKDAKTQIGIWRSRSELRKLASNFGWRTEIQVMPEGFYASHYRFDAILTR